VVVERNQFDGAYLRLFARIQRVLKKDYFNRFLICLFPRKTLLIYFYRCVKILKSECLVSSPAKDVQEVETTEPVDPDNSVVPEDTQVQ